MCAAIKKLEISRRFRHIGTSYTIPMAETARRFRVSPIPHRHHAAGKRKIRRRLDRPVTAPSPTPVFTAANIHYDVADKTRALSCGGIGAIQLLVKALGLAEAIDERLHLLKYHLPYTNAERVLPAREEYTRCVYRLKLSHLVGRTIPPGFERKHSLEW